MLLASSSHIKVKCHSDNKPRKKASLGPQLLRERDLLLFQSDLVVTQFLRAWSWFFSVCLSDHPPGFSIFCALFVHWDKFTLGTTISQEFPLPVSWHWTCDHWTGTFSCKPFLLLLTMICNLTSVCVACVRAHTGMHRLFSSYLSLVQSQLKLPRATSFSFLPPPFIPFLSPGTSLFASHFTLPQRGKSHYFWFRGSSALPCYKSCLLPASYSITREFRALIYWPQGMALGEWSGRAQGPREGVKGGRSVGKGYGF